MKSLQNADVRLTDDLERQLLKEAISAQYEYALDRAVKQFFHKVFRFLKAPKGHVRHAMRTAH